MPQMKRLFVAILTLIFIFNVSFAQDNEYRYFSFKIGLANNLYPKPKTNEYLLLHTPYGDFFQTPKPFINYTPGGVFNLLYHIDAKNDRFGIVLGAGVKTYGITIHYQSDTFNFKAYDQFQAFSAVIPIYIKFSGSNLYINQSYFTLGIKQYINFRIYNIQNGNWLNNKYIRKLSADEARLQTTALFTGINYNVFYFDLEYQLRSFINKKYRTLTQDGLVMPYKNLDFKTNLFFTFGIHIPLTRWITMRSWTAEQIRRFFAPVR